MADGGHSERTGIGDAWLVVALSLVGRELPDGEAVLEGHVQRLGERDPVVGAVLGAGVAQRERACQQPVPQALLNHVHRERVRSHQSGPER